MVIDTMSIEFMAEVCAKTCAKKRKVPNDYCPIFFSVHCSQISCGRENTDRWLGILLNSRNRESTIKNIKHNLRYLVNSDKAEDIAEAIIQEKLRRLRKGIL